MHALRKGTTSPCVGVDSCSRALGLVAQGTEQEESTLFYELS